MATTWYFRNIQSNDPEPSAKASTDTDTFPTVPSDKNVPYQMLSNKGAEATSVTGSYATTASLSYTMMRMFVGMPLLPGSVITGGDTLTIGIGTTEGNNQMNLFHRYFVYVRSEAGTNSKTILVPTSDPTEEGTVRKTCLHTYTGAAGDYTVARGDRIVCEVWSDIRNTKNTAYAATIYFDGTVDPVEDATSTDEAAYLMFNQDIRLDRRMDAAINFL